jgi:hypothetical protein
MIEARRRQLHFGEGLIAEEVSDLREAWMTHADQVFSTALALLWPGSGTPVNFGSAAGTGKFTFPGYSYELIQF